MIIFLDEGVHRHLRFKRPGSSMYYFDLVTWPGRLFVGGDIASWVFKRQEDMFEFFRRESREVGYINASYWSEKLDSRNGPGDAMTFSPELYRQRVREAFDEYVETWEAAEGMPWPYAGEVWQRIEDEVLNSYWGGEISIESEAYELLNQFSCHGLEFHDTWDWTLHDFDYHFLLSCHAIMWGISKYYAAKKVDA